MVRGTSAPVSTSGYAPPATSSNAGQRTRRSAEGRQGRIVSRRRTESSLSTPSSPRTESSQQKRFRINHAEELSKDEALEAELSAALDEMSASDFLELASDISEEDDTELEEEEFPDVTEDASVDAHINSRTKRSILLKKHIWGKIFKKKLRHKARKAVRYAARQAAWQVALNAAGLGGGGGLGGAAGVGLSQTNN